MSARGLGVIAGIIMIMIAFVVFPMVMTGAHEVLTDDETESFENVSTGTGETTATVTLSKSLYDNSTSSVTSITSDNANDDPTADSYNSSNKQLTVGGLAESATRTLTVAYESEATEGYTGLKSLVKIRPTLIFVMLLFSGGGLVYFSIRPLR